MVDIKKKNKIIYFFGNYLFVELKKEKWKLFFLLPVKKIFILGSDCLKRF